MPSNTVLSSGGGRIELETRITFKQYHNGKTDYPHAKAHLHKESLGWVLGIDKEDMTRLGTYFGYYLFTLQENGGGEVYVCGDLNNQISTTNLPQVIAEAVEAISHE